MDILKDQEIHLRDYFYILRKRRRIFFALFAASLLASVVLSSISTVLYKATTTILIEKENPNVVDFKEVMALDASNTDYYQTQYEMFKSYSLIRRLANSVELSEDPYVLSVQKGGVRKILKNIFFLPEWVKDFFKPRQIEDIFTKKMLKIEPVRNTRLVRVGIIHPDAARAAKISNKLAALFIEQNLENRFSIATNAGRMIGDQLIEMKQKVTDAGRKLQEYKEDQGLVNIPSLREKDPFIQEAKLELVKLQARESKLSKRYLPAHPKMIHIQSQIEGLKEKIKEEEQRKLELGRKSLDYAELEREEQSAKKIYTALLARLEETTSQSKIQSTNIQIVDKADVPTLPYRPNLFLNLAFGFFLGIVGGILGAFASEYFDASVRIPDDVEKGLGLELVGIVPHADATSKKTSLFSKKEGENFSATAESFRALRTALLFKLRHAGECRVVLVTSANPEEGKSTVALNLAAAFQQNHLRVLLIDSDLRKPRLHTTLNEQRKPGLVDVLESSVPLSLAIRKKVTDLGFDFLPAGPYSQHSTESLGDKLMLQVMADLRKNYDVIVIDSPPYLAVADVHVLSEYADYALVVTLYQKTKKHHLKNIKRRFPSIEEKMLGVVINDVGVKEKDYYYHQYCYYGYGDAPGK